MSDSLPSWRDTATRAAILDFVAAVTDEGGPDYVAPDARTAVFDNDGTLWTEKPMPTQLHYLLEQWKAAATADPSLADTQPYRAAVSGDLSWLGGAIDKHYAGDDSGRGDTPYDKGAEHALRAAAAHGFTVVSVRDDWSQVFPTD
jgi:hypothetical protein